LHRAPDQTRAHAQFAWGWCAAWTVTWAGIAVAQHLFVVVSGLSSHVFAAFGALYALIALFQRFIALPMAPRLLTSLFIVNAHSSWTPPMSEFGQPHEGLLVIAALLVGELLGHPFEHRRRLVYMRVHEHKVLLAETEAKALAFDERLRRCFAICHDLMMQLDRRGGKVRATHRAATPRAVARRTGAAGALTPLRAAGRCASRARRSRSSPCSATAPSRCSATRAR